LSLLLLLLLRLLLLRRLLVRFRRTDRLCPKRRKGSAFLYSLPITSFIIHLKIGFDVHERSCLRSIRLDHFFSFG